MNNILKQALREKERYIQIRREIHAYPELSNEEVRTAGIIQSVLDELGVPYLAGVAGHGVVATIEGNKPGKTVGFRADMDALQIQEMNDVSYQSTHAGCMHACGHDVHVAILLQTASILQDLKASFAGKVKLIFQPAEEMSPIGGSRRILASGELNDLDAIYGLHVWPDLPFGTIGIKAGPLMAASDRFRVHIYGKASHAAQPHAGIDSILVGADFVKNVQSIVSRRINPLKTAVISIGVFQAGARYNIIAPECILEGTVRTFDNETRDLVEKELACILTQTCNMYGARFQLDYERGYMPVINEKQATEVIERAANDLFGKTAVVRVEEPSTVAEDFAFYLEKMPGAFVWLGTAKGDETTALHTSRFNLDEDIIARGASLFAGTALRFLKDEQDTF